MGLPHFMSAAAPMAAVAASRACPAALSRFPVPDNGADGQAHRRKDRKSVV